MGVGRSDWRGDSDRQGAIMETAELVRRIQQLEDQVRRLKTGRTFNLPSGATQPTDVEAGRLWQDTDDNTIKMGT